MKCRYCEEDMLVNGNTGFICPYCGTDLDFDVTEKQLYGLLKIQR